jgi:type I restriction enzyme S subunit
MSAWVDVELKDVTENHDAERVPIKESDRKPGPYPYFGASGIVDHVADYIYDGEYLLIAEDGENLRSRKTPIAFRATGKFWVNNHAHVVRGNSKGDTRFLEYLLNNADISGFITGSTIPKLTQGNMARIPVRLPSLSEQRAIAHILGSLDDKIDLNRRMNETLEAMVRAIFEDAIKRKDGGWRKGSVYEIAEVIYGAPFASNRFNKDGDGVPLLRIRDLRDERSEVYTTETQPKGYLVCPGDIVVGMDGEFRAYLWSGPKSWLNQRVCVFKPKDGYSTAFVRESIRAPLAHVEATETATTVIHIGKSDIDGFIIDIPDKATADVLGAKCQPLCDLLVANRVQSRALAEVRNALLPKLISGEVTPG